MDTGQPGANLSEHFLTPWHICVHGLGLGRGVRIPDASDSMVLKKLVEMSSCLPHDHCQALSNRVLEVLVESTMDVEGLHRGQIDKYVPDIISHLDSIPDCTDYAWLGAQFVDCFGRLAISAGSRALLKDLLESAAYRLLATIGMGSERANYDKLMAFVNLFSAAGSIGLHEYLGCDGVPSSYLRGFLHGLEDLRDPFLRIRCSATAYAIFAKSDVMRYVAGGPDSHLERLLAYMSRTLSEGWNRPADEIHRPADYEMFALSLLLIALALLGRSDLLCAPRDWVLLAKETYRRLDIASKISQFAFYEKALRLLGIAKVEKLRSEFRDNMSEYISCGANEGPDAYLRCCYLVLTAQSLGCLELVPPAVWETISTSVFRISATSRDSKYFNPFMVTAYALCALKFDSVRLAAMVTNGGGREICKALAPPASHHSHGTRVLNNALFDVVLTIRESRQKVKSS